MEEQNNFWIDLVASLKKAQSKKQIQSDAKNLGDIYVPLIGKLSPKSKTIAQLKKDLSGVEIPVNLTGKVNKKGVVTSVQQATKQAQATANKSTIQVSMNLKKDKLINDIKVFGQQNTKLFKDVNMTAKYNSLLDSAKLASSGKEIQNLRMQLSAMRSELKANNLAGLTLGDTFKKTFKRATELFTGTGGIMLLTRQLRNTWEEALTLDKAYTDLIKVQNELTRSDYPDYLDRCNEKAQKLATTQKALIESVTEFSKSGYNLTESDALAEKATMLSNVGDMSASDSAKAIISGVQAYDVVDGYDDAVNKAEALIDKYNEIGNKASITTAEIAQGVQSVGSVFADANTSVDEFIALLAAGNRQYQNADALALGLRTSALRIRGCTAELELMGEETDGVAESTAKLEEKIKALTNVNGSGGVRILEADGETFRSIYDIFLDISKVYKDMSDVDQSALLELIAGKHRASAISATLNNMSEAQEIYQRSLEATGSAQAEYDKYLSSSEASLNQFKATMTETYQSVLDGSTVKGILDCGNATIKFVNSLGLVESTLKGLVAIGIVKTITTLSTAFKASAIQASNFGVALNTVKDMSAMARGTKQYTTALNTLKMVSAGLSETRLKQVLASKALSDADRIAILRTTGLTKAQSQAKLAQMGLVQSTKAQTTAQNTATASTFSLTAAVKGFGASLKAAFLSNPIGIAIMAISTAFGAITSAIDSANQKAEEARQKAKDAADTASNLSSELIELTSKYLTLSEAVQTDKSSKEELMTVQEELIKKLGIEGESIDTLISKYGSLDEAIKQLTLDELGNMENDLIAGVKATEEELKSIGKDYEHWYSLTNRNLLSSSGDDAVRAYEVLEDAGLISSGSYGTGGGSIVLTGDDSNIEGILENYQKLQDVMKALRESGEFTETELKDNPVFSQVYNRAKEMEEYVNAYNDAITDLNQNVAQQQMLGALKGMELPDTEEEFNAFRVNLVKTAQSSGEFIGSQEDIEKAINSYLATVPQFAGYYEQLSDAISNTTDVATQSAQLFSSFENTNLGERLQHANKLFKEGELTHKQYFDSLQNEIDNFDASNFTESLEDANKASQQFFTDSVQQSASGLSDLINKFDAGEMSVSEYLDGYLAIGETLDSLTDNLQENSAEWNKNGEAISDSANTALDETQSKMRNAMNVITELQDSTYALEQIMSGSVEQSSDDFRAYTNLIATDLAGIVSAGGQMANEISSYMGTSTEEITNALLTDTSNFSIAEQAIAQNTNTAIQSMADSISTLLDNLGNAISNFKVDISFGVKSIDWSSVNILGKDLNLPKINFGIEANGESLSAIGDAVSSFGKSISTNLTQQFVQQEDYHRGTKVGNSKYKPNTSVLDSYNKALDGVKDSSSSAKKEFNETVDFFERRSKVLENYLSLIEKGIENVVGAFAKNNLIDAQLGNIEESINNNTDALAMYKKQAENVLSTIDNPELRDKIVNGAVELTDIQGENADQVKSAIEAYNNWNGKIQETAQKLQELRQQLEDLELQKFTNIVEDFNDMFDIRENSKDLLDKQIDLIKESGNLVGESLFSEQISQSQKQLALLEEEKAKLVSQMNESLSSGRVQVGSEAWVSMLDHIQEVEESILDVKTNIEELDTELLNLHFEVFEKVQENFDNIGSELENLAGLFDDELEIKVSDGNGNWTDEALGQLGLLAQNLELSKYRVTEYGKEIEKLSQDYLDGKYTLLEYQEKLANLSQEQWNCLESAESLEDAIIDLNQTRIDEEIETIEELIDKYKEYTDSAIEALDAKKDLHDYEKSIKDKTGEIEALEREISSMKNDTSASTTALRLQKEKSLEKLKLELEEMEYEHSIQSQKDALNAQLENFEAERNAEIEQLRLSLENRELLISQSFENVKANASLVGEQIALIAQEHGIIASNAIISPWTQGENAIASYGEVLSVNSSAFIGNIMGVENEVYNLQNEANVASVALSNMFATRADNLVGQLQASWYAEDNLNYATGILQSSLINTLERGYNIGGITSALGGITSGLNGVADAANKATKALQEMMQQQDDANNTTVQTVISHRSAPSNGMAHNKHVMAAFAKGGVIKKDNNPLTPIAKYLGEDTVIVGKEGERVLTQKQNDLFETMVKNLEKNGNNFQWNIPNLVVPNNIPLLEKVNRPNVTLHYDKMYEINGDIYDAHQFENKVAKISKNQTTRILNDINRDFRIHNR